MGLSNRLWNDLSGGSPANDLSGNGVPAIVAQYQAILGANLVAMWDAQYGVSGPAGFVDTWRDQIGGRVLAAPTAAQRPVYAADGSRFGGKLVVQCAITALKELKASGLSGLLTAGSRPWLFIVARNRNPPNGTFPFFVAVGTSAASHFVLRVTSGGGAFQALLGDGAAFDIATTVAAADANVHNMSAWPDGVNLNLLVDSTLTQAAGIRTLQSDTTDIAVGTASPVDTVISDTSIALMLLCTAYPGAGPAASTSALAAVEYPP
jgi:hypothetical protein